VIDTGQRPTQVDLKVLSEGCDLLIIPAVPASLDTDGLVLMLQALYDIGTDHYRVLLTKVPPPPEPDGPQLRPPVWRSLTWTIPAPSAPGKPTKPQERSAARMAEAQSKCSGVLAKLKQRPAAASSIARPDPPVGNEPGRGRGRPPGKRSDPDYQPTTVL
jgi:hypothetical protein